MSQRVIAKVVHYWGDSGEWTEFLISIPADFPDAIDEARSQVLKAASEGMAYQIALDSPEAE